MFSSRCFRIFTRSKLPRPPIRTGYQIKKDIVKKARINRSKKRDS